MTGLMRGRRIAFPQLKFMVCSQVELTQGLKPGLTWDGLDGPFDLAQGRLLKRRSSTVVRAFCAVSASIAERAQAARGIAVGLRKFANWERVR
jgi:hypothetical protein